MNKSTAAFLGLGTAIHSAIQSAVTGTTMFVIRRTHDYIRVAHPGMFSWGEETLQSATRFASADDAWAAIELRNAEQYPNKQPFTIVPVKVTTAPGAEIVVSEAPKNGYILKDVSPMGGFAPYPKQETGYGFKYIDVPTEALFFETAEAAGAALDAWLVRYNSDYRPFVIEAYTQPARDVVVGRSPSTVTVELA